MNKNNSSSNNTKERKPTDGKTPFDKKDGSNSTNDSKPANGTAIKLTEVKNNLTRTDGKTEPTAKMIRNRLCINKARNLNKYTIRIPGFRLESSKCHDMGISGRVELLKNRWYGTVCDDLANDNFAKVFCR